MELENFLDAAEEWQNLGWAVQAQARNLLEGDFDYGSLNENAVSMISRFADKLYTYHDIDVSDLHSAIDEYEGLQEDFDDDE